MRIHSGAPSRHQPNVLPFCKASALLVRNICLVRERETSNVTTTWARATGDRPDARTLKIFDCAGFLDMLLYGRRIANSVGLEGTGADHGREHHPERAQCPSFLMYFLWWRLQRDDRAGFRRARALCHLSPSASHPGSRGYEKSEPSSSEFLYGRGNERRQVNLYM